MCGVHKLEHIIISVNNVYNHENVCIFLLNLKLAFFKIDQTMSNKLTRFKELWI